MSADNWTICPRCKSEHDRKTAERMDVVAKSYGSVPAAEYIAGLKAAETEEELANTLREDWEAGMSEDGSVFVYYGCSCACGFGYRFKHDISVPLTATWMKGS